MANTSTKWIQIEKTNAMVVAMIATAVFILIFSLVACKTLASQAGYQNRIISAKRTAVNQLKTDIASTNQLAQAYNAFNNTNQNVLGGNPVGTGPNDGNNASIILDALPSVYNFPALTTSLEALISGTNVNIDSISGTDDQVAQSVNQSSTTPQPIAMPFQVTVDGTYSGVQSVIAAFEHSIRPIQLQTLDLSGDDNHLTMTIAAQTYYQPALSLNIRTKVVK